MPTRRVTARDVVGIAHVVVGAQALGGALFGAVMYADLGGAGALVVFGLLAAVGAATAVAGLWLRDGKRRGAALAAGPDTCRLLLLVLAWPRTSGLDLLLTAALLGGVAWVWRTLPAGSEAAGPGRPHA